MKGRKWESRGDPMNNPVRLANLAMALESAARAKLMALAGLDPG